MEAPRCRTCGERHWGRVCGLPAFVTRPGRAERAPKQGVPERTVAVLEAEIEQLLAEIKRLKRELAGRPETKNAADRIEISVTGGGGISVTKGKRGRPKTGKALSGAERVRRLRAKVKRGSKAKDQAGL